MRRGSRILLCLVALACLLLAAGCDRAPAPAGVGELVVRDDVSIELERVSSTTPTDYMQPAPAGAMWITFRVENLRDESLPIALALDQERPYIVASNGETIQVNGMDATR
ncbi:MAG: hypothetical protein KJ747_02710, partial [Actinobacteria bacterium]|nr:hypothetical protein [Actinomycetota bacterium]MCG2806922.1 hypothetical protein [Coriobacteriia bacterium]